MNIHINYGIGVDEEPPLPDEWNELSNILQKETYEDQHEPHNQFDGKPSSLPGLTPTVRYQASCNEKWRNMELIDMENYR